MTEQFNRCWSEGALAAEDPKGTFWGDGYAFDCDNSEYMSVCICQNSSTYAYDW